MRIGRAEVRATSTNDGVDFDGGSILSVLHSETTASPLALYAAF